MVNNPLDADFIDKLLKGELRKNAVKTDLPKPTQLGPVKWRDETDRCGARGCGSPTCIRVRGIPYCTTHALYILNEIVLREIEHVNLDSCTCNAGTHSRGNIHTYDCDLVKLDRTQLEPELL